MTIDKTKECGLQRLDGPSIRAKRYRPSSADTGYDNVANALFTHRRQTRVRGGNVPYPRNVITTLYAFREQACNSHPHVTTLSKNTRMLCILTQNCDHGTGQWHSDCWTQTSGYGTTLPYHVSAILCPSSFQSRLGGVRPRLTARMHEFTLAVVRRGSWPRLVVKKTNKQRGPAHTRKAKGGYKGWFAFSLPFSSPLLSVNYRGRLRIARSPSFSPWQSHHFSSEAGDNLASFCALRLS